MRAFVIKLIPFLIIATQSFCEAAMQNWEAGWPKVYDKILKDAGTDDNRCNRSKPFKTPGGLKAYYLDCPSYKEKSGLFVASEDETIFAKVRDLKEISPDNKILQSSLFINNNLKNKSKSQNDNPQSYVGRMIKIHPSSRIKSLINIPDNYEEGSYQAKSLHPLTDEIDAVVISQWANGKENNSRIIFIINQKFILSGVLYFDGVNFNKLISDTYAIGGNAEDSINEVLQNGYYITEGDTSSNKIIYSFFDPNCKHCTSLKEMLKPYVDSGWQIKRIPVAILNGSSEEIKSSQIIPINIADQKLKANHKALSLAGRSSVPLMLYKEKDLYYAYQGLPRNETLLRMFLGLE